MISIQCYYLVSKCLILNFFNFQQNLFLWPSQFDWPLHPRSSHPHKRVSQPCQTKPAKRAKLNPEMEINPDDTMPDTGKKNPEAMLPGEILRGAP